MMRRPTPRPRLLACCIAACTLGGGTSWAQVDALQLRLLRHLEQPLRWDNVEPRQPYWREGVRPTRDAGSGLHVVRLAPGEMISVHLPAGEALRLHAAEDADRAGDPPARLPRERLAAAFAGTLSVSLSAGTGLHVARLPRADTGGRDWIIDAGTTGPQPVPRLARIALAADADAAVEFALFVSRRETAASIAPYRNLLPLPTSRHALRKTTEGWPQDYWALATDDPVSVELDGPQRLAVRSRLRYPPTATAAAQGWRIEASLDDGAPATFAFDTGFDGAVPLILDGVAAVLSREQENYLEIPAGRHRLTLRTSAPLLVRVLALDEPDYLLPTLNAPDPDAAMARRELAQTPLPLRLSGWGEAQAAPAEVLAQRRDTSVAAVHHAALALARDNRRREGSAVGAAALREAAELHRDDPTVERAAEDFRLLTFFRELPQRDKHFPDPPRPAWFLVPRLLEIGEHGRGTVFAGQFVGEPPGGLYLGRFQRIGDALAPAVYELPERFAPASLRIALQGPDDKQDKLYIQFDGEAPVALTTLNLPEAPGSDFVPSGAEAALQLLQGRFAAPPPAANAKDREARATLPGPGQGTVSGAFGSRFEPAPLIRARVAELPLPASVRRVTLWRDGDAAAHPLRATVSYRTARPYRLTERAWLQAERELAAHAQSPTARIAAFVGALGPTPPEGAAAHELDSHWQPLARLLRAQAAQFAAPVAPPRPHRETGKTEAAARHDLEQAARLAARGEWLAALEHWSPALDAPLPAQREAAFRGRLDALRQLGEHYIVELLLRQRMLHHAQLAERTRARDALLAMHRAADDRDATLATLAAALLHEVTQPDVPPDELHALVGTLAAALLDNDEAELALDAGLLLPPEARDAERLLRTAHALQWWEAYDTLAATLDEPRRRFWRGLRTLESGDLDTAATELQAAGEEGQRFAAHLARGRQIHAALHHPGDPVATFVAWADWQATHPGPRRETDAGAFAIDFAGAQLLRSVERDTWFTMLRAEPERPLRLRVPGPVRLRIEARPLHAADAPQRLDGWLRVRGEGRDWLVPITANAAARSLELVGRPELAAGRAVTHTLDLGPGWHTLDIDGGGQSLLVRPTITEPALRLPVLPRLTADTAAARAAGPAPAERPLDELRLAANRIGFCPDCTLLLDERPATAPRTLHLPRERLDAAHSGPADTLAPPPDTALPPLPPPTGEAALRAAGDPQALLRWPEARTPEALQERVVSLVWLAEQQPPLRMSALALAAEIRQQHPEIASLAPLLARLERDTAWTPIESVSHSAGLRSREIAGWQPESPALRVRRALLPTAGPDERLLGGGNRLVVSTDGPQPARFELALSAEDVGALPATELVALLQVDDAEPRRIPLSAGSPAQHQRIGVPAGAHTLRVWIEHPLADQFLRVHLREAGRREFAERVERYYQVATRSEPVRLAVDGPAWLRIDEWFDGHTETRYQRIDGRWQHIVLAPAKGRSESLYRLHLRRPAPGRPQNTPRDHAAIPQAVPDPALRIADPMPAPRVTLHDGLPLGGQEDGTWTLGLARRERLYGFEDALDASARRERSQEHERFVELSATHRYFAEAWHTHYRSDLLLRDRERGGPTLGLRTQSTTNPAWTAWNLQLEGSLYAQSPGANGHRETGWQFSAATSARQVLTPKLDLLPRVSVFWRGQSLGDNRHYRLGRIDQDVYSPYRDSHGSGLEASETLLWRPWLDTELYAGAGLTTNPDFNPLKGVDHLSATLGWRQLSGPLWLDARWIGRQYFEDSRRNDDTTGGSVQLEVGWEHWLPHLRRIELGLTLRRDLARDTNLLSLQLLWHFGNGRAYRDFRPGEIDFRGLRERRLPSSDNNRLGDAS
jgi:hypothetical protein